jgi:multidrug efflux pump subunit AcrA (membrane-fusion protein)
MLAYSLRFPLALLLSLSAGAAGAQSQPQTGSMTLGVARSGVVQTINVADGDHVEAGHVLIALDCRPLANEGLGGAGNSG